MSEGPETVSKTGVVGRPLTEVQVIPIALEFTLQLRQRNVVRVEGEQAEVFERAGERCVEVGLNRFLSTLADGANGNTGSFKTVTNAAGELKRVRAVSMHADRVCFESHGAALLRIDFALRDEP